MNVKLIAALALAGIAATLGGYWLGRVLGISSERAQCTAAHASAATGYASEEAAAQQLARQAQAQADAQHVQELTAMLAQAQDAAATAAATAAAAQSKAQQLTDTLEELTHDNATVATWDAGCLPPALLARLHPQVGRAAYPAACRGTSSGDAHAVPAHSAGVAAGR